MFQSWNELENHLIKKNAFIVLPIYMYDHSGITISVNPFSCPWDSGQIGFIYISKEKARKEYSKKRLTAKFKKQISEIKKTGFTITHLDGHQHIHMAPGVLKIVIKLMKEEGINYVRFPLENLSFSAKLKDPCGWIRNIILSFMCGLSWKPLVASGLKHNDFFIGHARALRLRRKDLFGAIAEVKDGLTELGCHPGERTEECDTLCDKAFLDELKNHSIELVSWDRL